MMVILTAHAGADTLKEARESWSFDPIIILDGQDGMMKGYQRGLEAALYSASQRKKQGLEEYDILAYFHDDFILRESEWAVKVLREFDDPTVGLVGFGGALIHGSPDLYKRPYDYHQLGRSLYLSNMDDAEIHGKRFEGACDVAVLDGFALIVRRKILEAAGGWPLRTPINYSLYDYFLCTETHRQGYRIRLLGLRTHHYGGRTAVALKKADGQGAAHEAAHRWIYDNYRDVLPWDAR